MWAENGDNPRLIFTCIGIYYRTKPYLLVYYTFAIHGNIMLIFIKICFEKMYEFQKRATYQTDDVFMSVNVIFL